MLIVYTVDTEDNVFHALISIISLRKFSGTHQNDKVIVFFVEKIDQKFARLYKRYRNVVIDVSERFYPEHPWSNNLLSALKACSYNEEQMLFIDCDMVFVDDFSKLLTNNCFNSRIAGRYSMPKEYLEKFFKYFKIKFPGEKYIAGNGKKIILYPSAGVIYTTNIITKKVFSMAVYYAKEILMNKLNDGIKYVDPAAICLALNKIKTNFVELPVEAAFHMGKRVPEPLLDRNSCPAIIHHAGRLPLDIHYRTFEMPNIRKQILKGLIAINDAKKILGM